MSVSGAGAPRGGALGAGTGRPLRFVTLKLPERLARAVEEPRFFSPAEAIAQLPKVKPLLAQLREAFHEYRFAKAQADEVESFGGPPEELEEWRRKERDLAAVVEGIVRAVNETGADVKDPILGLIDFYHRRGDGSVVLLCYRDDEDTIRYWHDLERGFAGRRPLTEL